MPPSNKLGRYEILQELGRGAMGRVFLANDPEIERQVAIKTIQLFAALPVDERDAARERLLAEARAAGKLLHPGIVTLFDVGEDGGQLYLAMEYVEGTTLDRYCKPETLLPLDTVVELVAGVAETLDYAHRQQVVHRDIKPANLMRVGEAEAKIMDFGLARAAQAQLTHDGALLGTPSYMSPEQIRGETIDGRSDLFSLAVVLFEMVTGEKPFPGDSISSIIYRIVNEPAREVSGIRKGLPGAIDAFLVRAMSKNLAERYADGATFAAELRRAVAGRPPQGVAAQVGPVTGQPPEHEIPAALAQERHRSSPRPFVLAALLLVVAGGAAAYHFREQLGITAAAPREVWWETSVRSEPPGLEILLDGVLLDEAQNGLVRYRGEPPFGMLSATLGCRSAEHSLAPEDAGSEVVLVLDPTDLEWTVDPQVPDARVRLNGEPVGASPVALQLDLCRGNRIEVEAQGHHRAVLDLPSQATPLEARTALAALALAPIPMGRVLLPETEFKVIYYVNGERVPDATRELELEEGTHTMRAKNEGYWVDVSAEFRVAGGDTVTPSIDLPPLTTIVVQAFPANCKVHLRRPGGRWRLLDDTPLRRQVAPGPYEVRVTLNPTGEAKEISIDLAPGENPPVRVAFGRSS